MPKFCTDTVVLWTVLLNQGTRVVTIPEMFFGCVSLFQECVLLRARPRDQIVAALQCRAPPLLEKSVVFALKSPAHFVLLLESWIVKIVSAVTDQRVPHLGLECGFIASDLKSMWLVSDL